MSHRVIKFSKTGGSDLIEGPAGAIEISARLGVPRQGADNLPVVVICHPHPLYQGSMNNKVVTTLARGARELGFDQLRFNFRGVGKSEGHHADMLGEAEDLELLLDTLTKQGRKQFVLAGFSFGSGVASLVAQQRDDLVHLALVAPPVSKYKDTYVDQYRSPVSVYQGSDDEVIDAAQSKLWAQALRSVSRFYWYPQTSHFFHGKLTDLNRDWQAELQAL